ncbi:MAG: UDP-N-acetylmuramoyl-L-alanine--D-glutamate ligase [Defluviitaleaceae bacterium]|nr:UDP-N-acetylmuramoyl-L-alanine--D-glutamate ligase [Defluviitaleaceae bacterium]
MRFDGKKVLVCGMARSGQAAAALLVSLGAAVTAQDLQESINWAYNPKDKGLALYLGQNPDAIVGEYDLVVISPGLSIYLPFIQQAKAIGIPVWGEAELAFKLCPCPVIGITGTNGKTTVTTLLGEILTLHNPKTVVAGNIGIPLTSLVQDLTPDSIVVAEISSFQLETAVNFKPNISAVLNMTEDHLDRHKDMETYIEMKSRIFANQRHPDLAVLNYDNPITRAMKPDCRVVWFSESTALPSGVYKKNGQIYARISESQDEQHIISLDGLNIMHENALAATALALAAGVQVEHIAKGLTAFKNVAHRREHVANICGVDYYNDSKATNPDAAIKAITSETKPIILIGGGYDKGANFDQLVKTFSGRVMHLILIGQTAPQIIEACIKNGFTAYEQAGSLHEAVNRAYEVAKPGQVVLFSPACASMDMFKDYEERGDIFRQIVQALPVQ